MKKNLILLISFLSFISISFWLEINPPTSWNIENYEQNWKIILDEWENIIWKKIWDSTKVALETSYNNFLTNEIRNVSRKNITITCKNWFITKITGYWSREWKTTQAILSYNYDPNHNKYKNTITLICKPITQPEKVLEQNVVNANYQTVSKKNTDPFSQPYYLSTSSDPKIDQNKVKQHLLPWKDIKSQPTFVNILFLQLQTIWNLSNTLLTKNPNIEFKNLFSSSTSFNNYTQWINKFKNYSNLNDFVNAFTWTVWLKDIWIANDVINWLLRCLNTNNCNWVISFQHNPLDKFDVYKFAEIENTLYQKPGNQNILSWAIIFYQNLKNICENPPRVNWDNFLTNQIKYTCNALLSWEIDSANQSQITNFQLWYALWVRIKNLNNIKENIPADWINLKWIYNIFWELNNLTLWTQKIEIIKKVTEEPTLTWKYEEFKKIFNIDLKEIEKHKIGNNEELIKRWNIINTTLKALTPGTTLHKNIKSNKPNLNLIDESNFDVIDWKTKIKWISYTDDNSTINTDNSIKSARLETDWRFFDNLKINDDEYKKIGKTVKGYEVLKKWIFPEWTYVKSSDKEEIEEDFKKCLNNLWFFHWFNKKYDKCIEKALKKYDRVKIKCNRWTSECYASFYEWD